MGLVNFLVGCTWTIGGSLIFGIALLTVVPPDVAFGYAKMIASVLGIPTIFGLLIPDEIVLNRRPEDKNYMGDKS